MSSLIALEILGLPVDAVAVVLSHADPRAAMRLGLSCAQLLRWLDSYERLWVLKYEEAGVEVKSFSQTLTAKQRVARPFFARLAIEDPEFNSYYVLQRSLEPVFARMMQNGADFVTHTIATGWRACVLELSQWPNYRNNRLESLIPGDLYWMQALALGRRLAFSIDHGKLAIKYNLDTILLSSESTKMKPLDQVLSAPEHLQMPSSQFQVPLPSNDAKFETVVFYMPQPSDIIIIAHDLRTGIWSKSIRINPFWAEPHQHDVYISPEFVYNGEYLLIYRKFHAAVVKFEGAELRPRLIGQLAISNETEIASSDTIRMFLTKNHVLIYYLVHQGDFTGSPQRVAKLVKYRLDDTLERQEGEICIPSVSDLPLNFDIVSCGSLAAICHDPSVTVIDLEQNKILRQLHFWGATSVKFVDSTLMVLFSRSETIAVDFLAHWSSLRLRAAPALPPLPEIQLCCWNSTKEEARIKLVSVMDLHIELMRLLLCKNGLLVRGFESARHACHVFYRQRSETTKYVMPFELSSLLYRISGIYEQKLGFDRSSSSIRPSGSPWQEETSLDAVMAEAELKQWDDTPDLVFFSSQFDDSDPGMPRPHHAACSLEEARLLVPKLLVNISKRKNKGRK